MENGSEFWRNQNGEIHRLDGPAVIDSDGTQFYYQYGLKHREDGPAVIRANGTKEYWINGKKLTESEFNSRSIKSMENGNEVWKNLNGELHRLDGPAVIKTDGTQYYCQNGKLHRLDGPAVIYLDGRKEYYFYGRECTESDFKWISKRYFKIDIKTI